MPSNKTEIVRGVKYLGMALPLMILGPVLLTIGFKAQQDGIYLWLIIGIILILLAIITAFMGLKTILNGLFTRNE